MSIEKRAVPVVNKGFLYVQGCLFTVAGNAAISVGTGQARDSTNTFDMVVNSPITLDLTTNGLNGLLAGTVAPNSWYGVFVLQSSLAALVPKVVAVLEDSPDSIPSVPVINSPSGESYDIHRFVGWVFVNVSTEVESFTMIEDGLNSRTIQWERHLENGQLDFSNTSFGFQIGGFPLQVPPTAKIFSFMSTLSNAGGVDTQAFFTPSNTDPGANGNYYFNIWVESTVQFANKYIRMPVGRDVAGQRGVGAFVDTAGGLVSVLTLGSTYSLT